MVIKFALALIRMSAKKTHISWFAVLLIYIQINPFSAIICSLSRVGLVLLFFQYLSELGFHIARLLYFTDENHQKM